MHLHRNSDTSVAHWNDTVEVRQRTSWPAGGTGSSLVQTIYGACQCGTICNDVHCPNAVGGSRHIHRNHVKCQPACHGRRARMRRNVPLARRGRRRTFDTNQQVKKSVFSKARSHIPSRFQIVTVEVTLVAKQSSMLVSMREVSGSIPTFMHNF